MSGEQPLQFALQTEAQTQQPKRKIVIQVARRRADDEPENPKEKAEAKKKWRCVVCSKELSVFPAGDSETIRAELLFTKTGSGELLWGARLCCAAHAEELYPSFSGKILCSVCGKVALKGKKLQPSSAMCRIEGKIGTTSARVWFCSEACAARLAARSCAPKLCWTCQGRQFLIAEAIAMAKKKKFSSPEEAAAQTAALAKKITICSQCHLGAYCSPECQKADWPSHKNQCKTLALATPLERHLAAFGPKICPIFFALL